MAEITPNSPMTLRQKINKAQDYLRDVDSNRGLLKITLSQVLRDAEHVLAITTTPLQAIDYFAGQALSGMPSTGLPPEECAKIAYDVADAMMAERAKRGITEYLKQKDGGV